MRRTYQISKRGSLVDAVLDGPGIYRRSEAHEPLSEARVFGVDTESFKSDGTLKTLITSVHWHQGSEVLQTPNGEGMLERLCGAVLDRFGEVEGRPSRDKQRAKTDGKRNGRRSKREPCLSVWFNLEYDLGRLASDQPKLLRSLSTGADSYRVRVGAVEIEVAKLVIGSGSHFEWFLRSDGRIARMVAIDMHGYWKTALKKAAKSLGVTEKIEISEVLGIPTDTLFRMAREEFSDEQWREIVRYAAGDAQTTRELYLKTLALLKTIDARVVRASGIIPPSAPGAAARIVFARAFDLHPEIEEWKRPPRWADQLGCDSYRGARVFCRKRCITSGMVSFDIKSAYPYVTAILPDPVTATFRGDIPERFRVEDYLGKWGVLTVDGVSLEDGVPALRVLDEKHKRLKYVAGRFKNITATIPEIVIGVVSGTLQIDRVRGGVIVEGSSERSFLRRGMLDFFRIKNDPANEPALQQMAKLEANATYGKLIEVSALEFAVAESLPIPEFLEAEGVCSTIARIFAGGGPAELDSKDYACEQTRAIYADLMSEARGALDPSVEAVQAYIEALTCSGEKDTGKTVVLADYMRSHTVYRCGQYFLPLWASQITGYTSAIVGLMARSVGALQGDTDSVHVPVTLPGSSRPFFDGLALKKDRHIRDVNLPGFSNYEATLARAGYGEVIPECPELGQWFCEMNEPSVESILVRTKVYSHKLADGSFKQAKHGFTAFPRSGEMLHEAMRELVETGSTKYETKETPTRLRTAVKNGSQVGEFTSHSVEVLLRPDPNIVERGGRFFWRPF